MGKLGFMFSIDKLYENNLTFEGEIFNDDFFVILLDCDNLNGVRIVTFDKKFSYGDTSFFYLDKENNLSKHVVFDTSRFVKSKISVSDMEVIDLNQGLCWVEAQRYHKLRQLLFVRDGDLYDEIMKRIPFLCDFFGRYFQ